MEEPRKQKRFLWGVALAWTPWAVMMIGLWPMFRGIAGSKGTGLAAVAGGFAETQVLAGLAATLICEVSAMTLLFRASSGVHGLRSAFLLLSVCASGLMIILFGLSVALFWFANHHRF